MTVEMWMFLGLAWLACGVISFLNGWIREFHTWQWLGLSLLLGPLALLIGLFLTGRGRQVSLFARVPPNRSGAGLPRISDEDLFHGRAFAYQIREMKKAGRTKEASEMLEVLVEVSEEKSRSTGRPVHHWYYEQLANLHKKAKDSKSEKAVVKRYLSQHRDVESSAEKRLQRRLTE